LEAELDTEYPESKRYHPDIGARTFLATPLIREGTPIGVINIRRTEVRPFSEKQIALLKTFADQAVIAIENARLFQELDSRNNQLTESLEQQTATSEILGVIASSPTDLQPVLNAVAENAARLCDSKDAQIFRVEGDLVRKVASYGDTSAVLAVGDTRPISRESASGRAILDRQPVHIHDIGAAQRLSSEIQEWSRMMGIRAALAAPLLREGVPVGAIVIRRTEARPFSEKQIALLKTFADQAVIAIENVRLFQELQVRNRDLTESLEQQTATSELLRVIASSPTELQPVLDTVIADAVRLSGATKGHIRQYDGQFLSVVAHYNESAEEMEAVRGLSQTLRPQSWTARAIYSKEPVHVHDTQAQSDYQLHGAAIRTGARTLLAVPMLREDVPLGTITIWRDFVEPFTEREIELVKTFADQAVIAIENVRLFNELDAKNHDLTESLEQQTATSEILGVIASSPTDLQPVLDAVAENAARLCEADDAVVRRLDDNVVRLVAHYGSIPRGRIEEEGYNRATPTGRAIIDKQTIHVHDLAAELENEFPESKIHQERSGVRTFLCTPLLREGTPIGAINIRRLEVRPFSEKHIALLKTFADQAVIAIENVRLFQELQASNRELTESLEQQTATSEILGVIASSPTDLQPVLERNSSFRCLIWSTSASSYRETYYAYPSQWSSCH
jgi:GAF domain-containing protein